MAEEEEKQPIIVKKIKKVSGGHHGGAWKVAYADFVTAMMALFIVLWVLSASDQTRKSIEAYFDDPGAFNFITGKRTVPIYDGLKPVPGKKVGKSKGDGGGNIKDNNITSQSQASDQEIKKAKQDSVESAEILKSSAKHLEDFIKGLIGSDGKLKEFSQSIKFIYTKDGIKIELVENKENLFFAVGSAELSDNGKRIIALLAKEIGKLPNSVEIQGHTDSRKYGTSKTYGNWELSTDRANSTRRFMESKGLWNGQINLVSGFADKQLANKENPFAKENRRVTIYLKYLKSRDFLEKNSHHIEGLTDDKK